MAPQARVIPPVGAAPGREVLGLGRGRPSFKQLRSSFIKFPPGKQALSVNTPSDCGVDRCMPAVGRHPGKTPGGLQEPWLPEKARETVIKFIYYRQLHQLTIHHELFKKRMSKNRPEGPNASRPRYARGRPPAQPLMSRITRMVLLKRLCTWIDTLNSWVGRGVSWVTALVVAVVFIDVVMRYTVKISFVFTQEPPSRPASC
jgi:hypothetical protein